jgi:hypothetical protein
MDTVEKIAKSIKKGRGVSYIVRSFSISPGADKKFNKAYAKMLKYSETKGLKKPQVGDVLEYFIMRNSIRAKEFFNQ